MPASGNNENTNVINMQLDQNHVNSIILTILKIEIRKFQKHLYLNYTYMQEQIYYT